MCVRVALDPLCIFILGVGVFLGVFIDINRKLSFLLHNAVAPHVLLFILLHPTNKVSPVNLLEPF